MGNLLKEYYKSSDPEERENIRRRIEKEEEAASWNGRKPNYNEDCEMGG